MADPVTPSVNERAYVLDFERPIVELERKIEEMRQHAAFEKIDMSKELESLEQKAEKLRREVYAKLTPWQRMQLARHPQRPYSLDHIRLMLTGFVELHGDRAFGDDHAIVGGTAWLDGEPIIVIGQQKGRNTNENLYRNFGMPNPEGYRKALRLMKFAAKFRRPVLCLVDTQGAYPGIGAEERGISQAIAQNLFEMSRLPVPICVAIVGEGGSGGALAIGVGDRILMLENAWYSVISPESCSTIRFGTRDKKEEMAEALKLTAPDLLELGIIDRVVPEPFGGAHRDYQRAAGLLKAHIIAALSELKGLSAEELVRRRMEKFNRMGVWEEG